MIGSPLHTKERRLQRLGVGPETMEQSKRKVILRESVKNLVELQKSEHLDTIAAVKYNSKDCIVGSKVPGFRDDGTASNVKYDRHINLPGLIVHEDCFMIIHHKILI